MYKLELIRYVFEICNQHLQDGYVSGSPMTVMSKQFVAFNIYCPFWIINLDLPVFKFLSKYLVKLFFTVTLFSKLFCIENIENINKNK